MALAPLELGTVMMDLRVPDEIEVQPPVEILTVAFPASPHPKPLPIERLQDCILSPLLSHVPVRQVPVSLANLVSHLHTHRALGQRPNQRFEGLLCPVPSVIV